MKIKYLIFYIFIPIFSFYFFLIFMNYRENKEYLFDSTISSQIKLVQLYKTRIDERIDYYKKLLEEISKIVVEKNPVIDNLLIRNILKTIEKTGGFSEVYIGYESIHKMISSFDYKIIGADYEIIGTNYDYRKRPWYQAVLSTHQTRVIAPYIDTRLQINVISIATPILKGNDLEGVLACDLEFDTLQNDIDLSFPVEEGTAFLMTKNANILTPVNKILDYENPNVENFLKSLSQKESGIEKFSYNDKTYIFIYDSLENSDCLFVSILDEEKIFHKLYQKTTKDLLIFLFLMLFGISILLWISLTQKKLLKNEYLLNLFAKNSIGGVLITDKNGLIVFINKAFEKIFALKPKDFIGKNINELSSYFNNSSDRTKFFFDNANELPKQSIFTEIKVKNLFYRMQIVPLLENQSRFQGTILTIYDITHEVELESHKQKQEQILVHNSKMAALGEMVSAISHQWRQPLSTLLLSISDLEDIATTVDIPQKTLDRMVAHFNRSRVNINLMDETISIYRNFYKEDFIEKNFDITDLIEDVLFIYKPQIQLYGIEVEVVTSIEKQYYLKSQPAYLKQILMNVLSNAKDELIKVKQFDPLFHAKIKITIHEEANHYVIDIEDNGRGIGEAQKEHVFEQFFTTKEDDGTGMGLYLCKLLFENKIRGNIKLKSVSNPTIFSIELFKILDK